MKFAKILITLPTLAVICESAYEGFLPGIGNFKQNSKLKISIFDDTHGDQNSFNYKKIYVLKEAYFCDTLTFVDLT